MADRSSIEWTDASWNPIRAVRAVALPGHEPGDLMETKRGWHCEKVSPGCANCYAEPMNRRLGTGLPYKPGHRGDVRIYLDDKALGDPLRWRRPRKIFVGSMTDLFADFVTDEMLDRVFAVMALCPQHIFQLLTKRPERMRAYIRGATWRRIVDSCRGEHGSSIILRNSTNALEQQFGLTPERLSCFPDRSAWPLPHVWLGVSAEDQQRADERIPILLDTPAAIRWLSAEPLLGPLDLDRSGLDWVVVGGESGPGARPMDPHWARSLRDQCAEADVPFLFKQWGAWIPEEDLGEDVARATYPADLKAGRTWRFTGVPMRRVGKKAAGRALDGETHDAYPEMRA